MAGKKKKRKIESREMAKLGKEKVKSPTQRFDALIERVQYSKGNSVADNFILALKKMRNQNDTIVMRPIELCLDVLEEIVFHNTVDFSPMTNYYTVLTDAEKMYRDIFVYDEKTDGFEDLSYVFVEMFTKNNIYSNGLFDIRLFNSFDNKKKYVTLCQALIAGPDCKDIFAGIKEYGVQVREFMLNDDMFLSNLVKVSEKMARRGARPAEEIVEEELEAIRHMNGIYNVDPVRIARVEQNLSDAERVINAGADVIKQASKKTEEMRQLTESFESNIKEIEKREINIIESKIASVKDDISKTLDEYTNNQKKAVLAEKDALLRQLFTDAQTELEKYTSMAKTVTATASLELANLNRDAENVMNRISNMVNDDEEVKKLIAKSKEDKEFIDKVNKLSMLNDKNIDVIGRHLENVASVQNAPEQSPAQAGATANAERTSAQPQTANAVTVAEQEGMSAAALTNVSAGTAMQYVVNNGEIKVVEEYEEDRAIKPVNPLLDPAVPFKQRFEIAMKEKKRMMEAGEHFHRMFDDVLVAVMENANPYMIGPSGCGKTYMVRQIAKVLGMEFVDIGYINEEYEILGFQTATGKYSRPNFYRCYKYGMIAFCDELDNGNSRATVKLNSFLSNHLDSSYSFPNGENVKRHGSFRIIAAGNTEGNGADANYNTREKIEESVQQRFIPMYIDYDNDVEKAILAGHDDWYEFVVMFRNATDAWAANNGSAAQGILTTRDAYRIKQYLTDGSFDMSRIIKYEFIQTKDLEYLAFLDDNMRKQANAHPKALEILKNFSMQVRMIRERGHH